MADFIRSIQPQLMTFIFVIVILTVVFLVLRKSLSKEFLGTLKRVYWTILGLASIVFVIFLLAFSSVNETPRSKIDDSAIEKRGDYFEKSSKKIIKENSEKEISDSLK